MMDHAAPWRLGLNILIGLRARRAALFNRHVNTISSLYIVIFDPKKAIIGVDVYLSNRLRGTQASPRFYHMATPPIVLPQFLLSCAMPAMTRQLLDGTQNCGIVGGSTEYWGRWIFFFPATFRYFTS